ncbi:MAG: type II secretion system GspH family protein [Candidatus Kaiserbacteria bacterium]|nr:type II secretion system GspH family protein [Candidatus Kaiserbacteria bacterium]
MMNRQQAIVNRQQEIPSASCLVPNACPKRGFTLIETMVAITLLTVAITAPMTLATKSLSTAYYARDQIAAFNLAQEAIESVRHIRDGNVLHNALGLSPTYNLLRSTPTDIPTNGNVFTIDTTNNDLIALCPTPADPASCPPLKETPEGLFGYVSGNDTKFVRSVTATFLKNPDGSDNTDEIHVEVTVTWISGSFSQRRFTISENLFRWVNDGSGSTG